jgi:hypothetical protein
MSVSISSNASTSKELIERLNEDNYTTWRFVMQNIMLDLDLWDIITGDEIKPEEGIAEIATFNKRNRKALAKINLSIDKSLFRLTKDCSDAVTAWSALENHFAEKDRLATVSMRRELYTMKYDGSRSMIEHIHYMRNLNDRLAGNGLGLGF